jgi:hypothetical protein
VADGPARHRIGVPAVDQLHAGRDSRLIDKPAAVVGVLEQRLNFVLNRGVAATFLADKIRTLAWRQIEGGAENFLDAQPPFFLELRARISAPAKESFDYRIRNTWIKLQFSGGPARSGRY